MKPPPHHPLFLALPIYSPWPELPSDPGVRLIDPEMRHLTLAFLGEKDPKPLSEFLPTLSSWGPMGRLGEFTRPLFLPKRLRKGVPPRVVAWEVDWMEGNATRTELPSEESFTAKPSTFESLVSSLHTTLLDHHYLLAPPRRPFLSHVTLARGSFDQETWKETFVPLPLWAGGLTLYESLGHSKYRPLWSEEVIPPFRQIEHTADLAFEVTALSRKDLFYHALWALCFAFPPLFASIHANGGKGAPHSIETIVPLLNTYITQADQVVGTPFKAVTYHGQIQEVSINQRTTPFLQWEMIIDV